MLLFIDILIVSLMFREFDTSLRSWLRNLTAVILVLVPFHAFLTVWLASAFGHYTALRLWKEAILVLLLVSTFVLIVRSPRMRRQWTSKPLFKKLLILIGLYGALHVLIGGFALAAGEVTAKALGYAFISNLRYVLFFLVCVAVGSSVYVWVRTHWKKLLLVPAGIVVCFGLLQFTVLPNDFLQHFGYGNDTIKPYIAVDQKPEYARVQSSMRGPNPLGAYMVVVLAALVCLAAARSKTRKPYILLAVSLLVLFGTYSRSAWLGAALAACVIFWLLASRQRQKYLVVGAVALVAVCSAAIIMLRDNDFVQNIVFHTDETSLSSTSSNEDRANAITGGVQNLVREPLGRGPGTAGPASVYNDGHAARISENYFLQIGQEIGLLGLALFVAICVVIGCMLWQLRSAGPLPLLLLASLAGLSVVNLLSHAWADDTLAYVWWGFAGLAVGTYMFNEDKPRKSRAKEAV